MKGKPLLLIRRDDTFLVNTIKTNLNKNAYPFQEAAFTIRDINRHRQDGDLMVLYTDEILKEDKEVLLYIRDICVEDDKRLLVIGGAPEFDVIRSCIPEELVAAFAERPLNMEELMEQIGDLLSGNFLNGGTWNQRKKSVLIVDDDPTYLKTVREWLKDRYTVSMVSGGMQAITWLAVNNVDLILLDYEMPAIKGSKVLEMLRSEPTTENIPVIFLTGKSDKESIMEVLALKPAGYLLKSIDRSSLRETLEKFFKEPKHRK